MTVEIGNKQYPFFMSVDQVMKLEKGISDDVEGILEFIFLGIKGGHIRNASFWPRVFYRFYIPSRKRISQLVDVQDAKDIMESTVASYNPNGQGKEKPKATATK